MRQTIIYKSALCGVVSSLLLAGQSQLAVADTIVLEEIIITAERRAESLQDTPMSVTAFTGDMVEQGAIVSIEDIGALTPNFKITTFNISEPQLYLRGIGTTNDSVGADPAVAVFVDDVYLGRPSAASTDLYDLERIEVLRGPQGTLYGRNAAGGALNIFTKKPQREFEAKAGSTVGNYGLFNARGYVNGPISDTVAGKVTVNTTQRDGYAENVTTGQDLEDADSKSIRGQLLLTPSDNVEWLVGFDYTDISQAGSNRHLANITGGFAAPQQAEANTFGDDPRKSNANEFQSSEKELFGLQARADVNLDWATFTSITAYRESESSWRQALVSLLSSQDGGSGLFEVNDRAMQEADQVSQEFRLSSETDNLKWVAGLYYFKENAENTEQFVTYWDPIVAVIPGLGAALVAGSPGDVSFIQDAATTSMAAFGQVTWDITETVALTTGARYTKDEKEIENAATTVDTGASLPGIPLFPGEPYSVQASDSWGELTFRGTIDWNISENHLLYVTYSEGFKSGAFNFSQSSPEVAAAAIQPELAINHEIGLRTQWLENRLRFNATYFQLDYKDLQTFSLSPTLELVAGNASAEVSGIETDFAIAVTENFRINGSFATLDGEFVAGGNVGKDTPRSPGKSWSLAGHYLVPLGNGAELDFATTASFTDDYHIELNNDPRGFVEDVTVVDASVKYTVTDQSWDIQLWGKNVTDELYSVHHINGTLGGASRIYAPPRTYGMNFNYHW